MTDTKYLADLQIHFYAVFVAKFCILLRRAAAISAFLQRNKIDEATSYSAVMKNIIFFICGAIAFVKAVKMGAKKLVQAEGSTLEQFKCGLIELSQPRRGASRVSQQLINDDVLSKGVREVRETLYVYVHAEPTEPGSNVCEYISTVYSRLWDEMLQVNNLGLNCIVLGNMVEAGFVSLAHLRSLPDLQVVYSLDAAATELIRKGRAENGVSGEVVVQVTPQIQHKQTAGVFYLDDFDASVPRFERVAVGGTFDHLHNGHKKLLTLAAACCTGSMVIGVTGDAMLKKKSNAAKIASYQQRVSGVESFLRAVKPSLKVEPVELQDPLGPTIADATIQAIAVSSETIPGAHKINQIRIENKMSPLAILVSRRGEGATLSSTFLRSREKEFR